MSHVKRYHGSQHQILQPLMDKGQDIILLHVQQQEMLEVPLCWVCARQKAPLLAKDEAS